MRSHQRWGIASKSMVIWLLYILIIIFSMLDTWQTYLVLSCKENMIEGNPIVYWTISIFGLMPGIIIPKIVTFIPFTIVVYMIAKYGK